jgi:hypothetical protein
MAVSTSRRIRRRSADLPTVASRLCSQMPSRAAHRYCIRHGAELARSNWRTSDAQGQARMHVLKHHAGPGNSSAGLADPKYYSSRGPCTNRIRVAVYSWRKVLPWATICVDVRRASRHICIESGLDVVARQERHRPNCTGGSNHGQNNTRILEGSAVRMAKFQLGWSNYGAIGRSHLCM